MREVIPQVVAARVGIKRAKMKNNIGTVPTERLSDFSVEKDFTHCDHHPRLVHLRVGLGCRPSASPGQNAKSRLDLRHKDMGGFYVIFVHPRSKPFAQQQSVAE